MTDGRENASKKYSSGRVKSMVEEKKAEGWEFLFLAANIDAVETASYIGIRQERAIDYLKDETGTGVAFQTVEETVHAMCVGRPVTASWSKTISQDFKSRKRR